MPIDALSILCVQLMHDLNAIAKFLYVNKCCERKQHFLHDWHGTDQTIIDNAINKWRGRLCTCADKGEHLERLL